MKVLRSLKLGVVLLLLLASLAIPGTFLEVPQAAAFYRSPLFLALFGALCVNVVFCTWSRFSRRRSGGRLSPLAWLDLAVHLSILLILAGGLGKGLWGFVGTQYLFRDVETGTVTDGRTGEEVPLGFSIVMKEMVEEYYPFRARVGVSDALGGQRIARVELQEGRETEVPGSDLRLTVSGFDREAETLTLTARRGSRREDIVLALRPGGESSVVVGPERLTVIAWRQDLKRVKGKVQILAGDRPVLEGWLYVNTRMSYRGTSLFQTAWGKDRYMNPFIGIQVARDPAAPVFWTGCVLFSLAVPLFLFSRHRRGRGGKEDGR